MPSAWRNTLLSLAIAATQGTRAADSPDVPGGGADESDALAQIVVTARKHEELAQETPVALEVVTAEDIQVRSLANLVELGQFTPNVNFSQAAEEMGSPVAAAFFIRGVGQLDFTPTSEPGVGLYIDNVYIARAPGAVLDLAAVQQVEILKGPQGTLFGKNAIGGAINVTTAAPDFGQLSGGGSLTMGDWGRRNADLVLNVPMGPAAAARLDVGYRGDDGFVQRPNTGATTGADDTDIVHLKVLARPGEDTEVTATADYTRTGAMAPTQYIAAFDPTGTPVVPLWNALVGIPAGHPLNAATSLSPNDRTDLGTGTDYTYYHGGGGGLQLDHEMHAWHVRWISAYRSLYSRNQRDSDGSPASYNQDDYLDQQHQWSQEIDLTGTSAAGQLHWTLGAYYFREIGDGHYQADIASGLYGALEALPGAIIPLGPYTCPGGPACAGGSGNPLNVLFDADLLNILHARSRSTALFGDLEWALGPRLSFFGGVRYTQDVKSYAVSVERLASDAWLVPPTAPPQQSWSNWSPQLGLKWQRAPDQMLYATVSEGYKAGGFNPRPGDETAALTPYDPEQLWAYELGAKSEFAQHRVRWNSALFDYDYRNMQLLAAATVNNGTVPTEIITNVGHARLYGGETELAVVPTPALTLKTALGYLDAHYLESAFAITGISQDTPLQKAPRFTGSAAAEYLWNLSRSSLLLRADCAYTAANFPDVRATADLEQHAYALMNSRIAWTGLRQRWSAALYAKNLLDRHYALNGFDARATQDSLYVVPGTPREVGVQVAAHF